MLLLGIDIGTSSVKVSVVDADTQQSIISAQYPETEAEIISLQSGWASKIQIPGGNIFSMHYGKPMFRQI
jgi:ribulose kinase